MKLQLKHAFQLSRILKKMKLRPDFKEGMTQTEYGQQLFMEFIENIGEAEKDVYIFIGDLTGEDPEKVKEWDFKQFADFVEEFKSTEGIEDFFSSVTKLIK